MSTNKSNSEIKHGELEFWRVTVNVITTTVYGEDHEGHMELKKGSVYLSLFTM